VFDWLDITLVMSMSCSSTRVRCMGAPCVLGSCKRDPIVVGKPAAFMLDYIANKFEIRKDQICMVGDRLDTDILFGIDGRACQDLLAACCYNH